MAHPMEDDVAEARAEQARVAREKRAASAARGEWQPIETAPRDGTRVLAWDVPARGWGEPCSVIIFWDRFKRAGAGAWLGCSYNGTVTHWQPLPAPPGAGDEGA